MRQLTLALAIGLTLGLAATWYFLRERADEVNSSATPAASTPRLVEAPDLETGEQALRGTAEGVTVHVVRSGARLAGAAVSIFLRTPASWLPLGHEVSDADGNVRFPGRPGRYALRAVARDGEAAMELLNVAWVNAPLSLELVFKPRETITGVVIDEQSRSPVPQATVVWVPIDAPLRLPPEFAVPALADAFGRFSFAVPPGFGAEVDASAPAYSRATGGWRDPALKEPLTLALSHAAIAAGVVVDEAGKPVANAIVSARPEEDVPRSTDADGRFELKLHPDGATLHALSPGGPQALLRVRLAAGERRGDLRLVVSPGTPLEGLVRDQAQRPLEATEVRVLAEPDEVELARVTTSAQGTFTAFAIPKGRYSIAAETAKHWLGRTVGVEHPEAGAVEVTVLAGTELEGTVRNPAGNPVANAKIAITLGSSGRNPSVAYSDEHGHYLAEDLTPGELTVRASLGAIADETRTVYIPPGETGHQDFDLGAAGRVKGRVTGPERRWSLFFMNMDKHANGKSETTDGTGSFDLALSPGHYNVFVAEVHLGRQGTTSIDVRPGETTVVELTPNGDPNDGGMVLTDFPHKQLGEGISFDNGPSGVRVDFLSNDSPMAMSGVQSGDLVLAIDGAPVKDSLDAFAKVRNVGAELSVTLRREGVERVVVVK